MPSTTSTRIVASAPELAATSVDRARAELLFDAEQPVVLRDAVGAAERSGLDLTGAGRNREVRDRRILRFPATVRDHGPVAGCLCGAYGFERLGECADLVELDQDRVRDLLLDAFRQQPRIGHEEIVPDELHAIAESLCELLPPAPVAFIESVFDRHNGG